MASPATSPPSALPPLPVVPVDTVEPLMEPVTSAAKPDVSHGVQRALGVHHSMILLFSQTWPVTAPREADTVVDTVVDEVPVASATTAGK